MALGCLLAFTACTTPPDGTFGAATFAVDTASPSPATAMATPVFIYDSDGNGHLGYDIALYVGADIPAGSPCHGTYTAAQLAELDIVTLQYGQRADLPNETLQVLAAAQDNTFHHSHDYVYFDVPNAGLVSDSQQPTTGALAITGYDGSYIDATFDVTGYQFVNRYEGDIATRFVEFTGSLHAGICSASN